MQSQLEAALLGHISNVNSSTSNVEDDDNNFQDEEEEGDVEDFVDEEVEGDNGHRTGKLFIGSASTTRTVTLQMLLSANILQPGKGTMTIEYLGQKFVGDLLEDGKIRSQETDIVFASPSAWAIACKRFINPDKKSGCGWASVKYRGKKLDAYKNVWYKKRKEEQNQEREDNSEMENLMQKSVANALSYHRIVVKHNTIANRTITHDSNTLIECIPFSNLGKIQPFLVSLSTNAALLMDFHCHLTKSEVSGYLAGHWDVNAHNLQVTHAFPCRNTKADRECAPQIEAEISRSIDRNKLTLVGWYHSHPFVAAAPTLRDIDAQLDYQIRMKGTLDNNYTPCIGIIISPYNYENASPESNIIAYWVIPPPEAKPNEYGRPMLMSYSVIQDATLTDHVRNEMVKCVDYYKKERDFVDFADRYVNGSSTLYIDKLKSTLLSKFPRDENESTLWRFIKDTLGCFAEENGGDNLLSIPSIGKSSPLLPNLNTPPPPPSVSISSSLMLPTDISSLLFNSGKFPSASSLLGLPDPMAHSTLAANNMFLSTNLFKMQELLKPLSTTTIKKSDHHNHHTAGNSKHLKIPTNDLFGGKGKMDFVLPDLNISKCSSSKEFSVPDFGSLNLIKHQSDDVAGEKPSKLAKTDYMLDLSAAATKSAAETPTDLTITTVSAEQNAGGGEEKPLNLTPADQETT